MIDERHICDIGVVGGKIKADRKLADVPAHLPSSSGFMTYIIGQPGSGKTSLLISMLTAKKPNRVYKKAFQIVFLVIDKMSYETIDSLAFKDRINFIYHDLTPETIDEIDEICKYYAHYQDEELGIDDGVDMLLILDDVAKYLKSPAIERQFGNLVLNRRHRRLSIIITSQFYRALAPNLRSNISHLILFHTSKREFNNVFEEHLPYNKEQLNLLFNKIYRLPHDFLYFDVQNKKIYRNFGTELTLKTEA